jgi:hypothetical protein
MTSDSNDHRVLYHDAVTNMTPRISSIRRRDKVLRLLLPKTFGLFWRRGQVVVNGYPVCSVQLQRDIVLSVSPLLPHRMMLSVYAPVNAKRMKVLSAHVTNMPMYMDPDFYRNCDGCVCILSWRRGKWEDVIMADPASTLSIPQFFSGELFAIENRPPH